MPDNNITFMKPLLEKFISGIILLLQFIYEALPFSDYLEILTLPFIGQKYI